MYGFNYEWGQWSYWLSRRTPETWAATAELLPHGMSIGRQPIVFSHQLYLFLVIFCLLLSCVFPHQSLICSLPFPMLSILSCMSTFNRAWKVDPDNSSSASKASGPFAPPAVSRCLFFSNPKRGLWQDSQALVRSDGKLPIVNKRRRHKTDDPNG